MSASRPMSRSLVRRTAVSVAGLTATAVLAATGTAHAADTAGRTPAPAAGTLTDEEFYALADAEIEKYLTLLAQVPVEVLDQGGPAVQTWLDAHTEARPELRSWIKCAGLITAAVAGALIPASKIVKVAKIVKKFGVKRVINAIKGVRKGKGQTLTKDLKDVALIFLGVDEIKEACGG